MPRFREFVHQLMECFSPCFGRKRNNRVVALELEAEETLEKASDSSVCEPSCPSLQVHVCPSPELDEVVSIHFSSSHVSVPSRTSPSAEEDHSPRSPSPSPVSLSSSSQLTASPDLQMVNVEDEEDMEKISGKSSEPQVECLADLVITDMEEMDCEDETENSAHTTSTLAFTRPGPLRFRGVAWMEDSEEEEEKEEVLETEVMEIKDCEEEDEEPGDSDSSQKEKQQAHSRRKVSLVIFTWAEKKVNERVERKMKKEQEKRERLLRFQRYRNDPNFRHLKINKHNPHYSC